MNLSEKYYQDLSRINKVVKFSDVGDKVILFWNIGKIVDCCINMGYLKNLYLWSVVFYDKYGKIYDINNLLKLRKFYLHTNFKIESSRLLSTVVSYCLN